MECIPAIDLRAGQAVRLVQGDFADETGYGDPVALARRYADQGARRLHVVDLDAARGAPESNRATIEAIVAHVGVEIQVGGGIRSEQAAATYIEAGVGRIVLGTAAVEDRTLLERLCAAYPGRVLLGLDHRRVSDGEAVREEVAVRGWTEGSGLELGAVLESVAALPLAGVVITDISRDGMLSGPDLEGLGRVLASSALAVIASGGVSSLADLTALCGLEASGRRLAGAIVGKALLSGAFDLTEAIATCAR